MYRYLKVFSLFLFVCFIQTAQSEECHELFQTLNTDEIQSIFSDPANYNKYKGQEGYLLVVQKTPNSDSMNYIFQMVSQALEENFKELGWQKFHGSVEEFRELRGKILDESGKPREKYIGQEGYALFAKDHYKRAMLKAFQNVSSVLSESEFKELGWQAFHGSELEFHELRGTVLDESGKLREKYIGQEGYALFAKDHYDRAMLKAFQNVSSVLSESEFKKLGWQAFHGSELEFHELRGTVLDESGKLREKYVGQEGYALFAKDHYKRAMQKAFQNVSSVLSESEFKKLGWQAFHGSELEFHELRGTVLDESGKLREKYVGQEGYALFAKDHYKRAMQKAFMNVSSVLSESEFNELGWQGFNGSELEFHESRGKILDESGKLREKYIGQEGYALFAKDHYKRAMQKAFMNVSSVLSESEFNELGWQEFHGSELEFHELRGKILDESGKLIEKYIGQEGYALFAKDHYKGAMQKAFINVSSVLSESEFKELGWQEFHGSELEFHELRGKILDESGKLIEKYIGQEGYALFAKDHYKGAMQKAFINVSSVLSESEFKELGWQEFHGSELEFHESRGKILDESGKLREKYIGQEGYALFAKDHYDRAMLKAFLNVSSVLSESEFKELGWQAFQGSELEFHELRRKILDESEKLREKYIGQEGYALFAKDYYDRAMLKAFKNVSSVLGGHANMKNLGLDWKQFNGKSSEYWKLFLLFKNNDPLVFQGVKGQKKVAKEIFKGNTKRTYNNVSALREHLLGSWEAFKDLGWSSNL